MATQRLDAVTTNEPAALRRMPAWVLVVMGMVLTLLAIVGTGVWMLLRGVPSDLRGVETTAEEERTAARRMRADVLVPSRWRRAEAQMTAARRAYDRRDWQTARRSWQEARKTYSSACEQGAGVVQQRLAAAHKAALEAEDAWRGVSTLDPGQGFGRRIEQARALREQACRLLDERVDGDAARIRFEELARLCVEIRTLDGARQSAARLRDAVLPLRTRVLEQVPFKDLPRSALRLVDEGAKAFEAGAFPDAMKTWRSAHQQFTNALERENTRRVGKGTTGRPRKFEWGDDSKSRLK